MIWSVYKDHIAPFNQLLIIPFIPEVVQSLGKTLDPGQGSTGRELDSRIDRIYPYRFY